MKGLHIENMKRVFDGFTLGPVNMDIGAGYICGCYREEWLRQEYIF